MSNRCKSILYPTYSIQFWFDKRIKYDNPTRFLEVSNPEKGRELKNINSFDMRYFSYCVAKSKLIDKEDREKFYIFCKGYIENFELENPNLLT